MEATIAKIKKNSGAEIWIELREYQGRQFVDIREHYLDRDSREWRHTRKGIMLQPKFLPEVIDGLDALQGVSELGTVVTIAKSAREEIQIGYREFSSKRFGEIRMWYSEGDGMKPSPKGVTFKLNLIDALVEALRGAEDQLDEQ